MPPPVDDEYREFYQITGAFIREWAQLEETLSWLLSPLLGIDHFRSRIILSSIRSFDGKRRLIEQLSITYAGDELNSSILSLMKRGKKLSRNRNMLAHHFGGISRKNQLTFLTDIQDDKIGTNFIQQRTIDFNSIRQWTKDTENLWGEIIDLSANGRLDGKIHALSRMHREGQTEDEALRQSFPQGSPEKPDDQP